MSVLVKLGLLALLQWDALGQTSAVGGSTHVFEACAQMPTVSGRNGNQGSRT